MQVTWRIANLERTIPSGVVFIVHYTVDATDGEFSAGAYGSIGLAGDPAQKGFIPFEKLTEEKVIKWVQDSLGEEKLTEIANSLAAQIDKQKNPTTAAGLPWINQEETVQ